MLRRENIHCHGERTGPRTMADAESTVEELSDSACWALLRTTSVGRMAGAWVDDHPDIFPINYAVDHGTVVFRSRAGTKVSAALSAAPVAVEADGYDADTATAWSVVIKGSAEEITGGADLLDTVDLPLFPWQAGDKGRFIRIVPTRHQRPAFPGRRSERVAYTPVRREALIDGMRAHPHRSVPAGRPDTSPRTSRSATERVARSTRSSAAMSRSTPRHRLTADWLRAKPRWISSSVSSAGPPACSTSAVSEARTA